MLPKLANIPAQSTLSFSNFHGINTGESYRMGEFKSAINLDSDKCPSAGTRPVRSLKADSGGKINGVGSYEGIFFTYCTLDNSKIFLHFKENDYEFTSYSSSDDFTQKRQFAAVGDSILIIPDNVVFKIGSLSFKKIAYSCRYTYATANNKAKAEINDTSIYRATDGTKLGTVTASRISSNKVTFIPGSYVEYDFYPISFPGYIESGDMVFVKMKIVSASAGTSNSAFNNLKRQYENGVWLRVTGKSSVYHRILGNTYITDIPDIYFESGTINTGGFTDVAFTEISIEKTIPRLTAISSFASRIWGVSGKKICTSRLGDADEWNDFSSDAYGTLPSSCFSTEVGTDGEFTDIKAQGNYIYAFKENYIHKIYGDTPSEYTITALEAPGCIANPDTLSVCNGYIIYASAGGIYILREGYPKVISQKIGRQNPISAASFGGKYYMICQKAEGRCIYVYDLERDLWTSQSCLADADNLHSDTKSICYSEGGKLICLSDTNGEPYEDAVDWSFSLRVDRDAFGYDTAVKSHIRLSLGEGANINVNISYDDGGESASVHECYNPKTRGRCTIRLPIKRDLGFYLNFSGSGEFMLHGIKFYFYKPFEE